MKYKCTLIAVRNMEISKRFYRDVLGLGVLADFGANVLLTQGISLQTVDTWAGFIRKRPGEVIFENNAAELYFEEDDIDAFVKRLNIREDIAYLHHLIEHSWGQRAVRFYDPDRHIIEVGESIDAVIGRYTGGGLSIEETALKMDVPTDYIKSCLEQTRPRS